MHKIELLKLIVDAVDKGNPNTVGDLIPLLEGSDIKSNMHVGEEAEFFNNDNVITEWYLGQYLNIIENEKWMAMNSLINSTYEWLSNR